MDKRISFEVAIYFLPEPEHDPLAELDVLLKGKFQGLQKVEKPRDQPTTPCVAAQIVSDVAMHYHAPDLESLKYFGRGLSREQAEALQQSKTALALHFAYSKEHVWTGVRSALSLTESLARRTGGLIWDQETREVFTADAWKHQRIDDWTEIVPNISQHVTIHAYQKDKYVRAISLGMAKFGLPDVVIENFSWSFNHNMGNLMNLFLQAIAEGEKPEVAGEFDLNIRAIKNRKVREAELAALEPNASAVAPLSLKKGTWEEGDPMNRLIEITFDRCEGPDVHARQEQLLGNLFGWEDRAASIKHDDELESASQRARRQLPGLRKAFNKGLAPGEFVLVKAPFSTPDDSHEWMWVEVTSWKGNTINGLLSNEPTNIPSLHAGQIVEVSEADVFDYIRQHADGTREGNETGKLIEKRMTDNGQTE